MITVLIAAVAAATAQPADAKPITVQPVCQTRGAVEAASGMRKLDNSAKLQRLDQLPPANLILTVLRSTGKCTAPVIVRYGIGQRVR